MRWHFWNQHKPDFCKPLVVYWINCVGNGFFLEGEYDPRGVFVELDGTEHSEMSDGTRWIYKDQFVEALEKIWAEDARAEIRAKYGRCVQMWTKCEMAANRILSDMCAASDMGYPTDKLKWKLEHARRWKKRWLDLSVQFETCFKT